MASTHAINSGLLNISPSASSEYDVHNWQKAPDFSWLTVLIKKYVRIYHIGFSTFFFNIWHEQLGEKLLTMLERTRLSLEQFVENDENIAL